jgi:hypothetical protein
MRVYIAGPINGKLNGNREAFAKRATQLTVLGHDPVNPWDIPPDHPAMLPCLGEPTDHSPDSGHRYGCYLRADIAVLLNCEGISLLDGWEESTGASTEAHVARSIGLVEVKNI